MNQYIEFPIAGFGQGGSQLPQSNVTGPNSSTNNAIALWNGTGGNVLQNSVVTVDPSGNMAGIGSITASSGISTFPSNVGVGTRTTNISGNSGVYLTISSSSAAAAAGNLELQRVASVAAAGTDLGSIRGYNGTNLVGMVRFQSDNDGHTDAGQLLFQTALSGSLTTVLTVNASKAVIIGNLASPAQHSINSTTAVGNKTATLTNSPTSGNPAGFLQITVNNETRNIPYW